jgi:serine phosphatase RsbU (regulator of sigma subunit)
LGNDAARVCRSWNAAPVPGPFDDAGSLREAYAAVDWSATSVGPPEGWSLALRTALDTALNTRFPVTLLWGPDYELLYNQAYVEMIADKHPRALGQPAERVFPEAWDVIGPMLRDVRENGRSTWRENALLPLRRSGFLEECWFSWSYSPVRGADGSVEGIIDITTETTAQMIIGRRLQLLSRLRDALAPVERVEDVPVRALEVLRENQADVEAVEIRIAGVQTDHDPTLPKQPIAPLEGDLSLEAVDEGLVAWLPLAPEDEHVDAVLVVRLSPMLRRDNGYFDFLRLLAGALTQALESVRIREAEKVWYQELQRSLLARPTSYPGVQIAARYQPAAEIAQVGGDWYDAFRAPDGSLAIVVGDVAGHDERAAASMGQIRNMLRGVAHTRQGDPSTVLSLLDSAIDGVELPGVATAVLGELAPAGPDGTMHLRWSNAGHPPPVLLEPTGAARLLETEPDLLLGLEVGTDRHDHHLDLLPGSMLVIYTDGLVERRGERLERGLAWLVGQVQGRADLDADGLSDHLLDQLQGRSEDDVALLVVRITPR